MVTKDDISTQHILIRDMCEPISVVLNFMLKLRISFISKSNENIKVDSFFVAQLMWISWVNRRTVPRKVSNPKWGCQRLRSRSSVGSSRESWSGGGRDLGRTQAMTDETT